MALASTVSQIFVVLVTQLQNLPILTDCVFDKIMTSVVAKVK